MNTIRRVETLEAAVQKTSDADVGYFVSFVKLVFLQEGETYEEHLARTGLTDYPSDRILVIRFVAGKDGSPLSPNAPGKQTENTD